MTIKIAKYPEQKVFFLRIKSNSYFDFKQTKINVYGKRCLKIILIVNLMEQRKIRITGEFEFALFHCITSKIENIYF